jgi:alpha-D-ribose 1-methylphosphonate 5-triphosphate synthase subunit PhnH
MATIAPPAPVLDAQRTFRTLLNAMAHPGTIDHLTPRTGETPEQSVCFALIDFEVSYIIANPGGGDDAEALEQWLAQRTGSRHASVADAAFVIAYGPLPDAAWHAILRGTLAFPDTGATIIYVLPAVGEAAAGAPVTRLTLAGPGIATTQELVVSGLAPAEFAALTHANREYPMGVDVILLDAAGRIACIPRSSKIQAMALTEGA